jgi:hypothetical protein
MKNWKFLFTRNGVCKHKEVDSRLEERMSDIVRVCAACLRQILQGI